DRRAGRRKTESLVRLAQNSQRFFVVRSVHCKIRAAIAAPRTGVAKFADRSRGRQPLHDSLFRFQGALAPGTCRTRQRCPVCWARVTEANPHTSSCPAGEPRSGGGWPPHTGRDTTCEPYHVRQPLST